LYWLVLDLNLSPLNYEAIPGNGDAIFYTANYCAEWQKACDKAGRYNVANKDRLRAAMEQGGRHVEKLGKVVEQGGTR
jgi:hypothetical protein